MSTWYWIDKNGKVYSIRPSFRCNWFNAEKYKLKDADLEDETEVSSPVTKKKVNSKDYFFNQDGEMLSYFIDVTESSTKDLPVGVLLLRW